MSKRLSLVLLVLGLTFNFSFGQFSGSVNIENIQIPKTIPQKDSTIIVAKPYSKEMEKSAKKGNSISQVELGKYYLSIGEYKKAKKWFVKASEQNSANAFFWLGYMFEISRVNNSKTSNDEASISYYKKAAELNHPDALYKLYHRSHNVNYLKSSARGGNMNAQYDLGAHFINKFSPSYSNSDVLSQAKEWFGKAAKQGHSHANIILGKISEMEYVIAKAKQEKARLEAIAAARRDSIARAEAEQHRLQDSIDVARGLKMPTLDMLLKDCIVYPNQGEDFDNKDFDKSDFLLEIKQLCENDLLGYFKKEKLDELDLALYKKSAQYKEDLSYFAKQKSRKFAVLLSLPSDEWDFYAGGFSFDDQHKFMSGLNYFSNLAKIAPLYMEIRDLIIPALSSETKYDEHTGGRYFKCDDIDKLQEIRTNKDNLYLLYIFTPGISVATYYWNGRYEYPKNQYLTNPLGLYLVNMVTGRAVIKLNFCFRKANLTAEKQRIETIAKARAKRYRQAYERNKPKYHKIAKPIQCKTCLGRGIISHAMSVRDYTCPSCNGRGYKMEHYY